MSQQIQQLSYIQCNSLIYTQVETRWRRGASGDGERFQVDPHFVEDSVKINQVPYIDNILVPIADIYQTF